MGVANSKQCRLGPLNDLESLGSEKL
jgi:hypothetical protein